MKLSYSYTCKLPHIEKQVALLTYILVDSSYFRIWLPPQLVIKVSCSAAPVLEAIYYP